jgi:hypothetical protein
MCVPDNFSLLSNFVLPSSVQEYLQLDVQIVYKKSWITLRKCWVCNQSKGKATVSQHPTAHHPLDACYYSVVDEPQLHQYMVSPWYPIL